MNQMFVTEAVAYVHIVALALWFGGLFGYVLIVWPVVVQQADGAFPRALLAGIAMRTAPWIYFAMVSAVLSLAAGWMVRVVPTDDGWLVVYSIVLAGLVANNVYGSVVAWPRMMLLRESAARREWFWFRLRMSVALVLGLTLYSLAVIAT
jgi:uncharacterized membrane protein